MTFTNILLIIYRYMEYKKSKDIAFLLRLRNKIFYIYSHYTYLVIEIFIHLIQPYPYISESWVIDTLSLKVTYNISSILASLTILRLYICMRVVKSFNMYNASDIKSINHFDINSMFRFIYRCNMRYRPFITLIIIFALFYYICSISFVIYERYSLIGQFTYAWNVLWLIAVTITTSIYL
jgi:hypothetical protein